MSVGKLVSAALAVLLGPALAFACPFCPSAGQTLLGEVNQAHLIVFGTPGTSALLAAAAPHWPLRHAPAEVTVGPLTFRGRALELAALYPDPESADHYLAMITPGLPSPVIQRLWTEPDYIVTDGEAVVARGFFDEEWRVDPERLIRE